MLRFDFQRCFAVLVVSHLLLSAIILADAVGCDDMLWQHAESCVYTQGACLLWQQADWCHSGVHWRVTELVVCVHVCIDYRYFDMHCAVCTSIR